MAVFVNPKNGKEVKVSARGLDEVFGLVSDTKRFICLPFGADPKKVKCRPIKGREKKDGICVIRMGGMGDLILMSSGLRELRERENRPLTVATMENNIPLMTMMGFNAIRVDDIVKYEFDEVKDMRFAVEPPQLGVHCRGTWESYTTDDRSDAFDKLLGVYPCPKRFEIGVDKKRVSQMKNLLPKRFILITASMVAPARAIPVRYIKPLCELIVKKLNTQVVLSGISQPWNRELKSFSMRGVKNLIDRTDTSGLVALCSLAQLVITPDTGTLHVAGALKKKTIGVFGNINPRTRISYYPTVKAIYPHGQSKCLPCWDLHPCMNGDQKESPECMNISTPEVIFEAVRESL